MQDINEDLYETLDLNTRNGAIVSDIVEDSPADKAGFEEGDVIVKFENKEISNGSELKNLVSSSEPGSRVKIEIFRGDKKKNLFVVLEERSDEEMVSIPKNDYSELGLSLRNPSESLMERFDFDDISNIQGVIVVDVQDGSPAQKAGIIEGDIISRVGRKKIFNTDDFDLSLIHI